MVNNYRFADLQFAVCVDITFYLRTICYVQNFLTVKNFKQAIQIQFSLVAFNHTQGRAGAEIKYG